MIKTVLIADNQREGSTWMRTEGLLRTTTRVVTYPDQVRGWLLDSGVRVLDRTHLMSAEKKQQIMEMLVVAGLTQQDEG